MAYIKEYWNNKEERARQAKEHTRQMAEQYSEQIKESVKNTIEYMPAYNGSLSYQAQQKEPSKTEMQVEVDALDSISAIVKYAKDGENIAVLNFASYKNPGGQFINGSKAQEECLCHASNLYNVLSEFQHSYYDWNSKNLNRSLYRDRALYSPDIIVHKDGKEIRCGVITCASPNKSAAQKYCNVSDQENSMVLKGRIEYVLKIAKDNCVDTLILGAYGCGVFGQDPKEVASVFKRLLEQPEFQCFSHVVFAIPEGRDRNLESFREVFKGFSPVKEKQEDQEAGAER